MSEGKDSLWEDVAFLSYRFLRPRFLADELTLKKKTFVAILASDVESLESRANFLNNLVKDQVDKVKMTYFCSTLCRYPDLDGFDQHFQATVHFPLTSTADKPKQNW